MNTECFSVTPMQNKQRGLTSNKSMYNIGLYINPMELSYDNNYTKFVKCIESLVRKSDEYSSYIGYLKNVIGLNYCVVFPKIDGDNAKIEMHHGPILTLYDYISILIEHYVANNKLFNSLTIAGKIIDCHYDNLVQVVMLSTSVHQLVHDNKIFIHPSQAFGNLNVFLKCYEDGITPELRKNINTYLEFAKQYRSNDMGILEYGDYKNYQLSTLKFNQPIVKDGKK